MLDFRKGTADLLEAFDRLPPAVKEAGLAELLGQDRPSSDFADPYTQKYPFHTPAATYASLVRLETEPDGVKRAALRGPLLKRAALFNVEPPAPPAAEAVKQATPALDPDDPLPLNAAEAEAAVKQAAEYHDRFALDELSALAGRVLAHFPQAVPAHLRGQVEKWAGAGAFNRQAVADALVKRAETYLALRKDEEAALAAELGLAVATRVLADADLPKLAEQVDRLDRETGLYGMAGIPPAREFCQHSLSDLQTGLEELVETKTGTVFRKAALATADTVKIAQVFGQAYYENLCDAGLYYSPERAAAAVGAADGIEAQLWARVVSPGA